MYELRRRLFFGLATLGGLLLMVGAFVVPSAAGEHGSVGILVGLLAGAIAFVGTALAMVLSCPTGNRTRDLHCLLISILARTGVPLVSVLILSTAFGLPLQAVFGMVLAYYLVALSVETWFAVQLIRSTG